MTTGMTLDQIKKLQDEDHWSLILKLVDAMRNGADAITNFIDSLENLSGKREYIVQYLSEVETIKNILRMKFCIMDEEWDSLVKHNNVYIINKLTNEEEEVSSLDDLI